MIVIEWFNYLHELYYQNVHLGYAPVCAIGVWLFIWLVNICWLIIDDRCGQPTILTKFVMFVVNSFDTQEYQKDMNAMITDEFIDQTHYDNVTQNMMAGTFLLWFTLAASSFVLPYAIVGVIIVLTIVGLVLGLRYLRRTCKRANNVPCQTQ